jgi:hypothetical protein
MVVVVELDDQLVSDYHAIRSGDQNLDLLALNERILGAAYYAMDQAEGNEP